MERAREEKEAHGEIETAHPGYLGAQDTYYVGTIKSVGRIYQQTFVDTYAKVAFAKLYDRKNALVAADMLNDRVLPFFEEQKLPLLADSLPADRAFRGVSFHIARKVESERFRLQFSLQRAPKFRPKAAKIRLTVWGTRAMTL